MRLLPPFTPSLYAIGLLLAIASSTALGQERTLRILIGLPPGGAVDSVARLVADSMRVTLGQAVVVENRPGAATRIALQAVRAAPPDGNTLLMTPGAVIYLYPHFYRKLGYEPFEDLASVAQVVAWDLGFAVNADSSARTLGQFLDQARANTKAAFFASASTGSLQHFMGLQFSATTKTPLEHVGFKGARDAVTALLGGQVPAAILTLGELTSLHRAGKVRVLASFGATRSPSLPDVPSAHELGYQGLQADGWAALYAPARTPSAIRERLSQAVARALSDPEIRNRILQLGMTPRASDPAQLDELGRREFARWRDVVKASGHQED